MLIKRTKFFIAIAVGILLASMTMTTGIASAGHVCNPGQDNEFSTIILDCPPNGDGVTYLLDLGVTILTGLVGVAAVVGIVYGAILYATAGGNSENTKKGLTIIKDTVIGIIAYAFMYVILNFVLPSGV